MQLKSFCHVIGSHKFKPRLGCMHKTQCSLVLLWISRIVGVSAPGSPGEILATYIGSCFLHLYTCLTRPPLQFIFCCLFNLRHHFFQTFRTKKVQYHVLQVLVHETMQGTYILPSEYLSECIWIPALKQLSLLLKDEVIKVRVCRYYNRTSHHTGSENRSIPEIHCQKSYLLRW